MISPPFRKILYETLMSDSLVPLQIIEPDDLQRASGLGFPHTSHCLGNGQIMISAMGDPEGNAKGQKFRG